MPSMSSRSLPDAPSPLGAERGSQHHGWALAMLLIGAILPPLDYFIVNLALPAIRGGLGASDSQLQFVISAYACANAVVLITGGRLGDLYGRKRMFMIAMAGFVAASALCGLAPSAQVLVAGRVLQGVFAATLTPQVLATIRSVFSAREQVRVMGLFGFVYGVAAVVGQLGGGALISLHPFGLGWRAIFLVNLPIGLVALLGSWRHLPESRPPHGARVDLPGTVLLSGLLLLLVVALTRGPEQGWPSWTRWSLVAAALLLPLFVQVERRRLAAGQDPLIDLRLFRNPVFTLGLLLAFLFYWMSVFFMGFGIYLQGGLQWSPLHSGLAILPFGLGFLAAPLLLPRLVSRLGSHATLSLSFGLLSAGLALAARLAGADAPGWGFYVGLCIAGAGQGLTLPSVLRIVLAEVAAERAGVASGMITETLQIGSAVGAAVLGGVFFAALGAHPVALDYLRAFRLSLHDLVLLLLGCLALTLLFVPLQARRRRAAEAAAPRPDQARMLPVRMKRSCHDSASPGSEGDCCP